MEMDEKKKNICCRVDVDGVISGGKQFDFRYNFYQKITEMLFMVLLKIVLKNLFVTLL